MSKNTICLWYDKDAEKPPVLCGHLPRQQDRSHHPRARQIPRREKREDVLVVEFHGGRCRLRRIEPAAPHSSTAKLSHSRSAPRIREKQIAIGTPSSAMAVRKANAAGARISGAYPGDHTSHSNGRAYGWWRTGKTRIRRNDVNEENRRKLRSMRHEGADTV